MQTYEKYQKQPNSHSCIKRNTIKPVTMEHGTTERGTLANNGTLAEQRSNGGTIGIPRNSGTAK